MVEDMTNRELRDAHTHRSAIYSWVAFIDKSEPKAIRRFINEATEGILEVEKEIHLREIPVKWN